MPSAATSSQSARPTERWSCLPLDKLQVTVWPNRPNLFGLVSDCNNVVCCTDSEDIQNEWQAVFQQLGVDVATKLPEADNLVDSSKHWAVPAIDVTEKGLEHGMSVEIQGLAKI